MTDIDKIVAEAEGQLQKSIHSQFVDIVIPRTMLRSLIDAVRELQEQIGNQRGTIRELNRIMDAHVCPIVPK